MWTAKSGESFISQSLMSAILHSQENHACSEITSPPSRQDKWVELQALCVTVSPTVEMDEGTAEKPLTCRVLPDRKFCLQ